jgi:hypothetical protein
MALLRPVDGAWLAALRVMFGLLLCVSMLRFLAYGWVDTLFVAPSFHFKYWGFAWVAPLPGPFMHALFWTLALLSLAIAAGLAFRCTAAAFALGLSYVQLIDVSTYLNHYYLAALLAWLLAASPAGRVASLDAWLRKRRQRVGRAAAPEAPGAGSPTPYVAAGWLYLFRFQLALVYVFAGLAKAQPDWLLYAQPLRIWLGAKTDLPLIGPLLMVPGVPLLMSWAGFLFDTTIVLWLCRTKSRPFAYAALVLFHVATGLLLPIGMFPAIMVCATLVFFAPDWPRACAARLRGLQRSVAPRDLNATVSAVVVPPELTITRKLGVALALGYCAVQLLLPLRHLAYGGNVLWHEQGMRLSWRVMLRAKGGVTTFLVHDTRTGRRFQVNPRDYLTEMQVSEMVGQPDLIVQLAHHIRADFEARGLGPLEIRADARASLNGRRARPLLDPNVDLGRVTDTLWPVHWITPAPSDRPPATRSVL